MSASAAPTNTSATPILDRQEPLPPAVALGSGIAPVVAIWSGILLALAACLGLGHPPVLRQWLLTDLPQWVQGVIEAHRILGVLLSILGACIAMLVIHEGGHILAGMCVGFRYQSLRVGPLQFDRAFHPSFYRGPGATFNAVAGVMPVTSDRLAARSALMVLGGPTANVLSGGAVLLVPFPPSYVLQFFAVISIMNGLSDLIPFHSRLGVSDGSRLWILIRHREMAERWLALMKLGAEFNQGVLPESWSSEFVSKAIAVRDESPDTSIAHGFAYSRAFHRHEDARAAEMLETCLRYSSTAPPAMREALMSDAAVFQARRRKRVDLAERWSADLPARPQIPWIRTRIEAAILEAKGDFAGALTKLDEFEQAILAMPAGPTRATMLKLLERWKSELRAE